MLRATTAILLFGLYAGPSFANGNPFKTSANDFYAEITALTPGMGDDFFAAGWTDVYAGPFGDWAGRYCYVEHFDGQGERLAAPTILGSAGFLSVTHTCPAIAATEDGGAVVVGSGMDEWGVSSVGLVARLDGDGNLLWQQPVSIGWYPYVSLSALAIDHANGLVSVVGTAVDSSFDGDAVVLRLDLETGAFDTSFRGTGAAVFDIPASGTTTSNTGVDMFLTNSGGVLFGGTTLGWGGLGSGAYLVRLKNTGEIDTTFATSGVAMLDFNERVQLIDLEETSAGHVFVHTRDVPFFGSGATSWPDRFMVVRHDGTRDPSFGYGGIAAHNPQPETRVRCRLNDDHKFTCVGYKQSGSDKSLVAWRAEDDGRWLDTGFAGGVLVYRMEGSLTASSDFFLNDDESIISGGRYVTKGMVGRIEYDGSIGSSFYR